MPDITITLTDAELQRLRDARFGTEDAVVALVRTPDGVHVVEQAIPRWLIPEQSRLIERVDRIDALEAECDRLEAENARLRETLRDWPWVPAIDAEAFYRNQARDQ